MIALRHTWCVMSGIWRVRAALLILAGALAVHHGRYALATVEHEHELAPAHGHLPWLAGAAAVLLFLAVVQLAVHLGRAGEDPRAELPRLRVLWLAASVCLLGVFGAQESLETFLVHGHPPSASDILAGGGWSAVPLAVAVGGLIALLLRGAATVVRWAFGRRHRPVVRQAPLALLAPRRPLLAATRSVARRLTGPRTARCVLEYLKAPPRACPAVPDAASLRPTACRDELSRQRARGQPAAISNLRTEP